MVIFFLLEIENNPETGCYFVGRGGFPNANGVLEGDAAVMVGKDCSFGAVAALQGYKKNYISIALYYRTRELLEGGLGHRPHGFKRDAMCSGRGLGETRVLYIWHH